MEFEVLQDDSEKNTEEIRARYRMLFTTSVGKDVLSDILVEFCHFGAEIDPNNLGQVAQYNVGIAILDRLKVFETGKRPVIEALLSVL